MDLRLKFNEDEINYDHFKDRRYCGIILESSIPK